MILRDIFRRKGLIWNALEGRKGEKEGEYIIYCLLIKPEHTHTHQRTKKKKKKKEAAYSGLIMEEKSILGLSLQ